MAYEANRLLMRYDASLEADVDSRQLIKVWIRVSVTQEGMIGLIWLSHHLQLQLFLKGGIQLFLLPPVHLYDLQHDPVLVVLRSVVFALRGNGGVLLAARAGLHGDWRRRLAALICFACVVGFGLLCNGGRRCRKIWGKEKKELTTLMRSHTHLICHVLKVCLTNSLWVSLFEGQRRGEELEVSHRNVRHV